MLLTQSIIDKQLMKMHNCALYLIDILISRWLTISN